MQTQHPTYWQAVWKQFRKHRLGVAALIVVFLFILVGIYAPLLASSKPLFVEFQGNWYFPLFRYLFYPGFFTKTIGYLLQPSNVYFSNSGYCLDHFSKLPQSWPKGLIGH